MPVNHGATTVKERPKRPVAHGGAPAMHHGAMSTDGNLGSSWDGPVRTKQLVGDALCVQFPGGDFSRSHGDAGLCACRPRAQSQPVCARVPPSNGDGIAGANLLDRAAMRSALLTLRALAESCDVRGPGSAPIAAGESKCRDLVVVLARTGAAPARSPPAPTRHPPLKVVGLGVLAH